MYQDVLGGLLRYILSFLGIYILIYLAPIVVFFLSLFSIFASALSGKFSSIFIFIFLVIHILYSIFLGIPPQVVLFSVYTLNAFLMGIVAIQRNYLGKLSRHLPLLWALACLGVLLSMAVDFPWIGSTVEIGGTKVETARDWDVAGIRRLAGLSRSSAVVGVEIAISMAFLLSQRYPIFLKILFFAVSVICIVATTAKTILIAIVASPAIYILFAATSRKTHRSRRYSIAVILISMSLMTFVVVGFPFLGNFGAQLYIGFDPSLIFDFFRLDSLEDRILNTWPEALSILTQAKNNELFYIFGAGLGSIGGGSYIYIGALANPADNMFVFLFVTFGLSGVLFFIPIFLRWKQWNIYNNDSLNVIFHIGFMSLSIATLTTCLESIFSGIGFGLLVGKGLYMPVGQQRLGLSVISSENKGKR